MKRRMRRLVFHFGQHKTGTTSLQSALAMNRAHLARHGVLYPRLPGWKTMHHALGPAFVGSENCSDYVNARLGRSPDKSRQASERAISKLRAQVASFDGDMLVLSSETFFRTLPEATAERFVEHLSELAEDVRMVCYIRHPADHVLSAASTQLQSGRRLNASAGTRRKQVLAQYLALPDLGLQVHAFQQETTSRFNVIDDFARRYLPGGTSALPRRPARTVNQTLSPEAMVLAEEFGLRMTSTPTPASLRHRLFREALRRFDQRVSGYARPRLRPGLRTRLLGSNSELRWLRDTFGCSFPDIDYSGPARADLPEIQFVRDLCEVDDARLDRLRRRVGWLIPS